MEPDNIQTTFDEEETDDFNECCINIYSETIFYKTKNDNNYVQNIIFPLLTQALDYSTDSISKKMLNQLFPQPGKNDYLDRLKWERCQDIVLESDDFYSQEFIESFFLVALTGFCSTSQTLDAMICLKNLVIKYGWFYLNEDEYENEFEVGDDFMTRFYDSMDGDYIL